MAQSKTLDETILKAKQQVLIKEAFLEGFETQVKELVKETSPVDCADELENLCHQIKAVQIELSKDRAYLAVLKQIQKEIS